VREEDLVLMTKSWRSTPTQRSFGTNELWREHVGIESNGKFLVCALIEGLVHRNFGGCAILRALRSHGM
jgi:hypothetical protein